MVAVTYGVTRLPTAKAIERAKAAAPRKSFFVRFMDALVASRMKQVHREIARHASFSQSKHPAMPRFCFDSLDCNINGRGPLTTCVNACLPCKSGMNRLIIY